MYILGINAYHADSSACLLKDGTLIAAAEEERFCRVKHWAGFPSYSILWCLKQGNIKLENINYVAYNQDAKANLIQKIKYTLTKRPSFEMLLNRFQNKRLRRGVKEHLNKLYSKSSFTGRVEAVEHHTAHLSSAFHVSPFESSVIVSIDGFGDFASTAWGTGDGIKIELDKRIFFPHSLGIFYQALTQFIGFKNYGDEYKVMGLAPYGKPTYMEQMSKIIKLNNDGTFELNLDYFRHHREKIDYQWSNGTPIIENLYTSKLESLLGSTRLKDEDLTQHHMDIARSVQTMYEEVYFNLLNNLYTKYGLDSICISGGCGMNSVANGKIRLKTPFKNIYVQSASGDAGGAIGAAFTTWHRVGGKKARKRTKPHNHAYWGPSFSNDQIKIILDTEKQRIKKENCELNFISDISKLTKLTAKAIADGKVVGWFQGSMEWGPRALGNRSILCDPRRTDMKDILNLKIKRRESFRPFAPSILREYVSKWFEQDADVPFMMEVFQIIDEKRSLIPAVTHVDGSGRLQTVNEETNSYYYNLIKEFHKLTDVPMILNTSFNENEPVVCKPQEALETFLRTKMDLLVLGDWMIARNNNF